MKTIATVSAIATCAALAAMATPAGAQAPRPTRHTGHTETASVSATCKRPVTEIVASDAYDQTTSTSWVNLTDGLVNFTTAKAGCVIVTLSGASSAEGDFMLVQAVLDGRTPCAPSGDTNSQIFAADEYYDEAHSMTYLCTNVATGSHSIQMQYETYYGSGATFSGHTLTVVHN